MAKWRKRARLRRALVREGKGIVRGVAKELDRTTVNPIIVRLDDPRGRAGQLIGRLIINSREKVISEVALGRVSGPSLISLRRSSLYGWRMRI